MIQKVTSSGFKLLDKVFRLLEYAYKETIMKTHTYTFRAKHFTNKEVINATIDANTKEDAENAALLSKKFREYEIFLSTFKKIDKPL